MQLDLFIFDGIKFPAIINGKQRKIDLISLFTPAQCVLLYQDSLRRDRLDIFPHAVGPRQLKEDWPDGPASRTYRHWLAGNGEQARWNQQQALADRVYSKVRPPWPANAEKEAAEYKRRYLERDENLGFSAYFSLQNTIDTLSHSPIKAHPSETEWGLHVVAYAFLKATIFLRFLTWERQRIREAAEYKAYQKISTRLTSFVDSLPQEKRGLWSFFLCFNLRQNLLIAEWNCTDPEQRSTLSGEPHWQNFLSSLMDYLAQNPRDVPVVHNALAWASVFNITDHFAELRSRYKIANGEEPDWSDPEEFDEDFNNLRQWLAATLLKVA